MAHQHEQSLQDDVDEPSQPQRTSFEDSTFRQRPLRGSAVRSIPIAINRDGGTEESSSEEMEFDTDNTTVIERDARGIARRQQKQDESPSTALLRAPMLQSLPAHTSSWMLDDEQDIGDQMFLPPAQNLSCSLPRSRLGSAENVSYGSLRDSQYKGRFLDGPASYRDKRTGDIRKITRPRVHFDSIASSSMPTGLSIGERIMRSSKKKNPIKQGTSSLTALMEASGGPPSTEQTLPIRSTTFYDDENHSSGREDYMLSTSMTGLELLRQSNASGRPPVNMAFSLSELPRDAQGHNALLSRTHSDPSPRFLSRAVPPPLQLNGSSENDHECGFDMELEG